MISRGRSRRIVNGVRFPLRPFKAVKTEINDPAAAVVLVTAFGKQRHEVTAKMVKVDGVWLLDSVK